MLRLNSQFPGLLKKASGIDENDKTKAFTLVELLVVITIIGILMALIMPSAGAALKKARIGVCASNLKQVMSMTPLYASENRGYIMPTADARPVCLTYDMGAGEGGIDYTECPANIGALYEYFDITSDAALCPCQTASTLGKANSRGNAAQHCHGALSGNYVDVQWDEEIYGGYDKDWQNYRSAYMRQSWWSGSEDPVIEDNPDGLEGLGVDPSNGYKPNKTRLKMSTIPTGSVLFAEDFSSFGRMYVAHENNLNIGFISGGVGLRHYDPDAYPFKSIPDHSASAAAVKNAYRWLEGKKESN